MSYVTLATWKKYANKREEDATGEALYQLYIDAAEQIVSDYLSYSPSSTTYTHTLKGTGRDAIQLKAKPVTILTSVTVDDVARDVSDMILDNELMTDTTGDIFDVDADVVVVYTAGWASVPALIQMAVMEIASLLSLQSGENIGVSSTSFDGGNTRSFINYTNFDKYLRPIAPYKVVRLW